MADLYILYVVEEADGAGGRYPGGPRVPRVAVDRGQDHRLRPHPLPQPRAVHGGNHHLYLVNRNFTSPRDQFGLVNSTWNTTQHSIWRQSTNTITLNGR